jgi:hypothetical protein
MRARQRGSRQRTGGKLLVVVALLVWSAGDAAKASPGADPRAVAAAGAVVAATASTSSVLRACRTQPSSAWTIDERRTLVEPGSGTMGDLVVDRNGTATLARRDWDDDARIVRTSSLPAAPGDPQTVPGPPQGEPDPDERVSTMFPDYDDHLGVDDSGALTTLLLQDRLLQNGQLAPLGYNLALSDRPAGGTWPTTPHVADVGQIDRARLHVNASGAAVALWSRYQGRLRLRVSYRSAAGAAWTPAQRLAPAASFSWASGIDDSGRVVVGYATHPADIRFVTGTPTAGWSRPHRFPDGIVDDFTVGAGGHARVTLLLCKDFDDRRTYTMSPTGRWSRGVPQPNTDSLRTVTALDGVGRVTSMRWEKEQLVAHTSDRNRQWRQTCVLAQGLRGRRWTHEADDNFAVNSRGDAVVIYRTWNRAHGTHLWASCKPVGQPWTEPIKLPAGATRRYAEARVAIGPAGHAAVAWSARNHKRITFVRMSSVP